MYDSFDPYNKNDQQPSSLTPAKSTDALLLNQQPHQPTSLQPHHSNGGGGNYSGTNTNGGVYSDNKNDRLAPISTNFDG